MTTRLSEQRGTELRRPLEQRVQALDVPRPQGDRSPSPAAVRRVREPHQALALRPVSSSCTSVAKRFSPARWGSDTSSITTVVPHGVVAVVMRTP